MLFLRTLLGKDLQRRSRLNSEHSLEKKNPSLFNKRVFKRLDRKLIKDFNRRLDRPLLKDSWIPTSFYAVIRRSLKDPSLGCFWGKGRGKKGSELWWIGDWCVVEIFCSWTSWFVGVLFDKCNDECHCASSFWSGIWCECWSRQKSGRRTRYV